MTRTRVDPATIRDMLWQLRDRVPAKLRTNGETADYIRGYTAGLDLAAATCTTILEEAR